MIALQQGSITVDGVDVSALPCDLVRGRINVVPQQPVFMPGTLRFNLDPDMEQGPASDACLIEAIQKVGLWDKARYVGDEGKELDIPFLASNWSVGEQQLLALARALLNKSPLLLLDEATSRYSILSGRLCPLVLILCFL